MDEKEKKIGSEINKDWFMRHRLFLLTITLVILGAGGIVQLQIEHYRRNFKIDLPVHVERKLDQNSQNSPIVNPPSTSSKSFLDDLKVGQTLGAMKIVSIGPFKNVAGATINEDNYRIKFEGQVEITGNYFVENKEGPGCGLYFYGLDMKSSIEMPTVRDNRQIYFCFKKDGLIADNFFSYKNGTATIVISDYELIRCGCEGNSSATLVKVITNHSWQTYTSKDKTWQMDIPFDWKVNENPGKIEFLSYERERFIDENCSGKAGGYCIPEYMPFQLRVYSESHQNQKNEEKLVIRRLNNIEFTTYRVLGLYDSINYETTKNDKIYNLEILDRRFENQIMSTFKFL
ncbi:MAG TPA: hypothetical protein VEC17_01895 [Candidatus Binatia bacterium]|nr:hypothetical protein [Candidatus Binatia bacterium]